MNFEENRLQTFHSWPANAVVEPQRVAKAGFFYTGEGLVVECFSCGGRISEWDYGDQVMVKHRMLNSECPFVKKPTEAGNIPILNAGSSNVSLYRSTHSSDSLKSNQGGINRNSYEGCSNIEHMGERVLQCEEASRNSLHLPSIDEIPNGSFENHSSSRSSSNEERNEGIQCFRVEVDNQMYYRSEAARLETFNTWPKPLIVSPAMLAKTGFYYTQEEDKVKCAFCSGVVGHWEAGDNPDREHRRHFPSCPLHYNVPVGNIPIDVHGSVREQHSCTSDNVVVRQVQPHSTAGKPEPRAGVDNPRTLSNHSDVMVEGIQQHRGPRHPKYSTVESRLRTFKNWPSNFKQTPEQLAQSGFYYSGFQDQVRCFHCDGGLRQWDDSDDPWVEHARWFSKCIYVLLMKGEEFIQQVVSQHPPVLPSNDSQNKVDKQETTPQSSSYRVRNITEEELNGLLNTIPVKMAIGVGLDPSKIRLAVRQKMEQTGLPYSTSDALIGAVLDMSSNSSSTQSPESPTPGPSQECAEELGNSSFKPNVSATKNCEGEVGKNFPEQEQASSKTLLTSQLASKLSQVGCAEQRIYTVGQTSTIPILNSENEDDHSTALLAEENRRLKEARLCKICMDEEVGVVFLPCGHLVTCINCTPSLQDCPLCRQPIKATVRTFLS